MRTDELVAMLASGATPVQPGMSARRFRSGLGWGLFGSTLLMALVLGVRPDIDDAAQLPMFWLKLSFPLAVAAIALPMAERLARPGMRTGRLPLLLGLLLAAVWALAAFVLLDAPPAVRSSLVFGDSWKSCAFNIALLSIPVFIASMWAMKGLAPTRPAGAGAAAGLLAGGASAAVYALHCPEMQLPFIGVWYVLGMMIPTAIGALIGRQMLRW